MVCIDHLESLWAKKGAERHYAIEAPVLTAALAAVIRGISCTLPQRPRLGHGLEAPPGWSTHQTLFVAVAHLEGLRAILEKRQGTTGTCEVTPADLVEANMPKVLVGEFPVVLALAGMSHAAFRQLLAEEKHPGFLALSRFAQVLGVREVQINGTAKWVTYDPAALGMLFLETWKGFPDFQRLSQILAGVQALLPDIVMRDQPLQIDKDHVERSLLRNILPGEVSSR